MSTLARQGALSGQPWSLVRDNQLRTQLETTFGYLAGVGVVAGGLVTHVSGLSVRIPSGTAVLVEGTVHTLSTNQDYTVSTATGTVYLWGTVTRTAANQANRGDSDTYALTPSENTSGVAPSSLHFLLAIITTVASAVTAIENAPPGKYALAAQLLSYGRDTVKNGETAVIPIGVQVRIFEYLTVETGGTVIVSGKLRVDA